MTDLDKSGHGFQRVRTYLGPSLGWTDELVQPTTEIKTGGVYNVQPGDSFILVNVPAIVTINLPDVRAWVQQTANQPATAFDRSITIKDVAGNAANFNIVVAPFGQQFIDNIQSAIVISTSRATVKMVPLIDLTGWAMVLASISGGGSGGGDVFKAGNNTFTGTNTFQGPITAPTVATNDKSDNVATTNWVNNQGYIVDVSLLAYAPLFSPVFTGDPKAPTPGLGDNDTSIATTAYVQTALASFSGGAPIGADYITSSLNPTLTNERVLTNTASITWDFSTPGQAKANSSAGGGNVSNVGTPVNGQLAQWTTATTIQGISIASLGFQPLDGDLTALSALTGTNTIYYRSATDIWSPVTFSGLTFSGGVLTVAVGGGNVSNTGTPTTGQLAVWTDATHIQGVTSPYAPLASPVFTGDPQAPTPAVGDNDTSIATTAFVKNQGYAPLASPVFTGDPRAPTPASTDNDTSIATTAFVKAVAAPTLVAFRAHKNNVSQGPLADATDTKLTFGFEDYDIGGYYDTATSRWTPPAGLVHIDGAIQFPSGLTAGPSTETASIYKNGVKILQGVTTGTLTSNGVQVSADDNASGTDFYELWVQAGGAGVVGGSVSSTFFGGHMVGGPKGETGATGASGSVTGYLTAPQGRLTCLSGTPVIRARTRTQPNMYYTPYVGNKIPIFDGTTMVMTTFLELQRNNSAPIGANTLNDWFVWNNGGTITLSPGAAWVNDTSRPAAQTLVRVQGIWLNSGAVSGGPADQRGTYVGTTKTYVDTGNWFAFDFGGGAAGGLPAFLGIFNAYNRVKFDVTVNDTASSWTDSTFTPKPLNNSIAGNQIAWVDGLNEVYTRTSINCYQGCGPGGGIYVGIGYDNAGVFAIAGITGSGVSSSCTALTAIPPTYGYHTLYALMAQSGGIVGTFYGSGAGAGSESMTASLEL